MTWKPAILLALVTTIAAPFGSYLAQIINPNYLWAFYFVAVAYLAYQMFRPKNDEKANKPAFTRRPPIQRPGGQSMRACAVHSCSPCRFRSSPACWAWDPDFFSFRPSILVGYEFKHAAAMNALAVTPPSFSALVPHLATAKVDLQFAALLVVVGAIGSFLGARITSLYVPGRRLKQLFGLLIVVMTAYKLYQILI